MSNFEPDHPVELAEPVAPTPVPAVAPAPAPEAPPPHHPAHKSVAREYFESIVVTLVMALFGMTFITQAVKVPTGSMLNTILVEDHLMVNKFLLAPHPGWLASILPYRDIRRGDIIVFKYPVNPEENYVKRVIGLPGDSILIRGTRVYINGKELPENKVFVAAQLDNEADLELTTPVEQAEGATYTVYFGETARFEDTLESGLDDPVFEEDAEEADVEERLPNGRGFHVDMERYGVNKPFTIPEGQYFCLGDNRDNSQDSRYWGTVPREYIVGRAMFVYWSLDESARRRDEPTNILVDILTHTRWGRTGTAIK